jgi:molybdopterin-guanine dinucleotide biosynthesis protein A
MGRDKALLDFGGRPLIDHALDLLRGLGLEPRICGSRDDLARFAPVIQDHHPGCGPLAGVEAALSISDTDLNLFVPVDLPLLPAGFLRWMVERAAVTHAVATVPWLAGRPQPLSAVYSRRLLHGIQEALAGGNFRMMIAVASAAASLDEPIDTFHVESIAAALIPETWPARPAVQDWFRNVNTPGDYEELVSHLEQIRSIQ